MMKISFFGIIMMTFCAQSLLAGSGVRPYKIGGYNYWLDFVDSKAMVMNGHSKCEGTIEIDRLSDRSFHHGARIVTFDFSNDRDGIACNNFTNSVIVNQLALQRAEEGETIEAQMIGVGTYSYLIPTTIKVTGERSN